MACFRLYLRKFYELVAPILELWDLKVKSIYDLICKKSSVNGTSSHFLL